jgi:hypothetical protein
MLIKLRVMFLVGCARSMCRYGMENLLMCEHSSFGISSAPACEL